MNVAGTRTEEQAPNVLPLFDTIELGTHADPLAELLLEADLPDEVHTESFVDRRRDLVLESQFPDQAMFVLDKQLDALKEKLNRIKFYLGDIDDLLPR